MPATVCTVPYGQAPPAPPPGTVWRFRCQWAVDRRIELVPVPAGAGPDPDPPPGGTWRVVSVGGRRVYIAMPQPWLHDAEDNPTWPWRGW